MNGLLEILTNKQWMIRPEFVHGILPTLQNNLSSHSVLGIERDKKLPQAINATGDDIFREYEVTEDGQVLPVRDGWNDIDFLKDLKQPFVNVLPIDGPISRDGGACSYGSREIRDWIMKAADNQFCRGHVLHVNTPGGSAWAKNDFLQAIDYAHAKGQRVLLLVDGLCASAGMYLAALCDEVYVMNPKDQLGCVGVMAAFFTMKNGEKNQYTGETYREYYATKSVNKNKEFRDVAEDNNAKLLIAELDELDAEFRADMKAAFPNAMDEHLDGLVFNAEDVMGILCDGQMMLGEVIARAFALADGNAKPIERTASRPVANFKVSSIEVPVPQQSLIDTTIPSAPSNPLNQLNTTKMKEQFPAIFALLQIEEMQVNEEGTFFNKDLLDTLNEAIEAQQKEIDDAKALADQLTADKLELEKQIAEKNDTIASLEQEKTELLNADADKAAQIETLTTDLNGAKESLETAQNNIAERDQQIEDLQAQVKELTTNPGLEPDAGAAPANNGGGAEVLHQGANAPQWDPSKSAKENNEAMKEYVQKLKKQIS